MALLETVPDPIAVRLRELRASAGSNGGTATDAVSTPAASNGHESPHAAGDGAASPGDGPDVQPDGESDGPPPVKPLDRPIVFASDIDARGAFREEWLVVDNESVYVFGANGASGPRLIHNVPVRSIREANAETKVGNGHIEIRTDDETISLIRFSQAAVGDANTITRQITALSKGEQPKPEKVDEKKKHCPKCKRVLPEDTSVCPACVNKRAVMLRLFRFLVPYKPQVALSVFIILATTALGLLPAFISGRMVDELIRQVAHGRHDIRPIVGYIGLLASAALVTAALTYGARRVQSFLGARVSMDIRVTLYNKYNQLSLGYYDKRSTGTVMSRITNDSEQIWDFLAEGLPWLVSNSVGLVSIGIVLFRLNWSLALLMLAPGPFIYMLNAWFMPRARKRWHHVWHRIAKMYSSLNSSLNGMRVVKAFAQEGRESGRFESRNLQVFEASFAANSMWATYWPILSLLMGCGSYIIWIYGGNEVLHRVMTVGTLTMFSG
ncbi:MAG TPA: ABC transporter transmembrane domain-containing protein, partial [Chthonomonadaceae bacterium]|nr:ABC transporter transmembrane domain-containing protein [Chthonomonadaceae bacterium]